LKALENADLLIGKSGIYQVNPDRIAYGKHSKRMAILRVYRQSKIDKEKNAEEIENEQTDDTTGTTD
jgi:hypothetical protein